MSRQYSSKEHGEIHRTRRPDPTWTRLPHQAPMQTQIMCRCDWRTGFGRRIDAQAAMKEHMRKVNGKVSQLAGPTMREVAII